MASRTRNRTPGVIANNEPGEVKRRYDALRLKRLRMAQDAGFDSERRLSGAFFRALESGPQTGWYMLEFPQPCQRCGAKTNTANQYNVNGWLLLQPVCVKCNHDLSRATQPA